MGVDGMQLYPCVTSSYIFYFFSDTATFALLSSLIRNLQDTAAPEDGSPKSICISEAVAFAQELNRILSENGDKNDKNRYPVLQKFMDTVDALSAASK